MDSYGDQVDGERDGDFPRHLAAKCLDKHEAEADEDDRVEDEPD